MTTFVLPPCHQDIEMVYEDEHLLVINKPSGLLSLSGKNFQGRDSVYERLLKDYPSAKMIHRLDFGTSGLMVIALSKTVNAHLTKQFQLRAVLKNYTAILYGHVADDEGIINAPIARGEFPVQKICADSGKSAQSHYKVLERNQDKVTKSKTTRILYIPQTGRTHQLRIHSQLLGYPIVGCDLYNSVIEGIDTQTLSNRLCLHASRLTFVHPHSLQEMSFDCAADFMI